MSTKFVMCINNAGNLVSLTVHKVYKIIPDEKGEKHRMIRIVDDTGEDYLFPASRFEPVQLSEVAEQTFDLEVA